MTPPTGSEHRRPLHFRSGSIVLLGFLVLTGCRAQTRSSTDGPPERIVSLVPTVTEILFAIGAGDRVVGISDFDTYPPEALDRPRVGALTNPNLESIFGLQPDLVVTYGTQSSLQERLGVAGIRQFPFVTGPIDHILGSIRALGKTVGLEENADELADDIGGVLDRLRATRPPNPPKVLLVHYRDQGTLGSFYSAGADSYYGELIEIAGGRNIFDDVDENAFQPSLEEVLERGPEVIVELLPTVDGGEEQIAARLRDWEALASVPAVRHGRVYVLAGDYLLLVGPRLHKVAEALAAAIRTDYVSSR